tara:strand:- start:3033 stop:3410 length:378 start_codon:yes stop_codon:yes gene_type:complete
MGNTFNYDELIENIMKGINNIYENINIYNALFIITPTLFNDIFDKLKNDDYPVTTLNEKKKFIENISRILLINNTQLDNIYNDSELKKSLQKVNLIIFIETPRIYSTKFYNMEIRNDRIINVFEL